MSRPETASIDPEVFIRDYNQAITDKATVFSYEDHEFLINYAYYVIQYMIQLKKVQGSFNTDKSFTIKNK